MQGDEGGGYVVAGGVVAAIRAAVQHVLNSVLHERRRAPRGGERHVARVARRNGRNHAAACLLPADKGVAVPRGGVQGDAAAVHVIGVGVADIVPAVVQVVGNGVGRQLPNGVELYAARCAVYGIFVIRRSGAVGLGVPRRKAVALAVGCGQHTHRLVVGYLVNGVIQIIHPNVAAVAKEGNLVLGVIPLRVERRVLRNGVGGEAPWGVVYRIAQPAAKVVARFCRVGGRLGDRAAVRYGILRGNNGAAAPAVEGDGVEPLPAGVERGVACAAGGDACYRAAGKGGAAVPARKGVAGAVGVL